MAVRRVKKKPAGSVSFADLPDDIQDDVVASLVDILGGAPHDPWAREEEGEGEEVRIGLENGPTILPLVFVDPQSIFDGTREVSESVVEDYKRDFRRGDEFPPVVIDSSAPAILALLEGGHRTAAAVDAKVPWILAIDLAHPKVVKTPEGLETYVFPGVKP